MSVALRETTRPVNALPQNSGGVAFLDEYRTPAPEEFWREQVTPARELLTRFATERDPEKQAGIQTGVRHLIRDAFGWYSPHDLMPENLIPWAEVKRGLVTAFIRYTPKAIPEDITLSPNLDGGPAFVRRQGSGEGLMPRQVALLIKRYGLADGVPMPIGELGREHGRNSSAIRQTLTRAEHFIRDVPYLRERVIHPSSRLK